jgi:transposase
MAGHDLLPGCQTAWKHPDCPGYLPSPRAETEEELVTGGMVCHCPCHGLQKRIEELERKVWSLAAFGRVE